MSSAAESATSKTAPEPEDHEYRRVDGTTLLGRLYRPAATGPAPFVIDVHGGAWMSGDRLNNAVIHVKLAAAGIGVFALDFRQVPQVRYPVPLQDVNYGIRWFKANAKRLGVTPARVGGLGSSSGGQQILLNALLPDDPRWAPAAAERPAGVDARLDFAIALWPVLDPFARYRMAQARGLQPLLDAHHGFFASEAEMIAGNPHRVLERNEQRATPPLLLLQGTADENVEHERADAFAALYRQRGGTVELKKYPGEPHTFATKTPDTPAALDAHARIIEFVTRT